MPDIDLASIAPVTDAEAGRLASPAAFGELASQITAQPFLAGQQGAHRGHAGQDGRGSARRWSRRRVLLTGLPFAGVAAAAALLVTLLAPANGAHVPGPGNSGASGANSEAAIQAMSFTRENGRITVIIKNPYADAAWYNADLARHHIPFTLQVIPTSPSLVGTILGGNYAPGVRELTGGRRCYYPSSGEMGPCLIGFSVPVNLKDEGSVWIGVPARRGQQYASVGSIFAPGEALAGLLTQVAGQPLSKVRPILASHHLTVAVCRDADNNNVKPDSVPGDYYVTNMLPWAPGQVIMWTGPKQFWAGSERVKLPGGHHPPAAAPPQPAKSAVPSPSGS